MPATIVRESRREPEADWNLYRRSSANRRVLFLELLVWAIARAEDHSTVEEFRLLEEELRKVRECKWSVRPWPGVARDNDAFLEQVAKIADVFANSKADEVNYPGRKTTPSAA